MSTWNMGSAPDSHGARDVVIAFQNNDAIGAVTGTLQFEGASYTVNGNWAAAGSVPGRNFSAFTLWGTDNQGATKYIAAAGTIAGPGATPTSIQMNLLRASTGNDQQYGWSGVLKPM
jgi:hypothetical protein